MIILSFAVNNCVATVLFIGRQLKIVNNRQYSRNDCYSIRSSLAVYRRDNRQEFCKRCLIQNNEYGL